MSPCVQRALPRNASRVDRPRRDVTASNKHNEDPSSESELSESSEEPSDDSSSEEEDEDDDEDGSERDTSDDKLDEPKGPDGIVNLRANRGQKPTMKFDPQSLGPDIRPFLQDFLPRLKAANDALLEQQRQGTLQLMDAGAGDDGEQYIEMDLGLGVLETKGSDADREDSLDVGDEDVLARLMGRENTGSKASIEVVKDTAGSLKT